MTQAATLNGQVIGQAERATRAVLDVLLEEADTPFVEWVALNLTAQGATTAEALVDQLVAGLRISGADAYATIDALASDSLLMVGETVQLTAAGVDKYRRISDGIAGITERLYRDLPHDDLVVARRVLETLTERARAELAAAS